MTTKLTGKQVEQIHDALLAGYSPDSLRRMVRVGLNEMLANIAGGATFSDVVFNLIEWAERQDRVLELVTAAHNANPNHADLQVLLGDAQSWFAPPPPTNPTASPPPSRPLSPAPLFLSYSRSDSAAMEQVRGLLQAAGIDAWIDVELTPGTPSWQAAIESAIRQAQAMLVILSPAAKSSTWVNIEVSFALRLGRRVFPLLVQGDETEAVPISLFNTQFVDGRSELVGPVNGKLLPALRGHLGMESAVVQGARPDSPTTPTVAAVTATPAALLASLRTVLAALYPTEEDARRVVADAGMTAARIIFSGQANNTWQAILEEAEKSGALDALLAIALSEYGVNQRLQAAIHALRPSQLPAPPSAHVATATRQVAAVIDFDWVTIPAGDFLMGSDKKRDKLAGDDETPQHTVTLPTYGIARTPVTVAQFAAFIKATGYRTTAEEQGSAYSWNGAKWEDVKGANWAHPRGPESDVAQKGDHPVTCVSWQDAQAFCVWASEQSGQSIRLPSEAEWEKAARGTDGRFWPWGDKPPTDKHGNFFTGKVGDTTPVGRYPVGASPYGVLDMAGNVWEWTSSLYKPYPYRIDDGREDASDRGMRVVRGGSFGRNDHFVRCAVRRRDDPHARSYLLGVRVVVLPPSTSGL
jgi:formylglycine-generating enzyme required for sulfatase activity/nucleotide-binding universal stress UspA family protein